ncbi:MAG: hypothetical protein PHQ59_01105 [Candidatus Daviesbacteria bacterium]|nr:hypothetical protein [Candidatus Daviesbacteria bacterium]
MKIVVLAGPGEVNKRSEMLSLKQKFQSDAIYSFDLSSGNLKDIEQCLTSQSLFNNLEKLLIVENTPDDLDLKKLVKKDNTATMLFLASNPKAVSKLLTSAKEINAKIMNFEAEKEISAFSYLDALIEGRQEAFEEMQKLLNIYGGMYVLAMIYYLLRRNMLPMPASTFMQKKIKAQKQKLTKIDFENLYQMIIKTDFSIKSGNLPENIAIVTLTQKFVNYLR